MGAISRVISQHTQNLENKNPSFQAAQRKTQYSTLTSNTCIDWKSSAELLIFSYFVFKCLILPVKLFVNCFTQFFVPKNGDSALSGTLEKQELSEKQL